MMRHSPVMELLANLIRIPSVNPSYEGGEGELACAQFVEDYLNSFGIETWRQSVWPDRPNVLALLPGKDRSLRIVFEAHTDTVSVRGMKIPPFEPSIVDGKMFGRGSCDTKGGLAAMMQAMVSLQVQSTPPEHDILLAAVVDEEYSYRGVVALCEGIENQSFGRTSSGSPSVATLAVVAEPTDLRLVVASKGVLRWKIETLGVAAHSSKPNLGRNAVVAMAQVIQRLEQDSKGLSNIEHPLLGSPTLNIGTIHGGVQVNFVPDRCIIELDRRLLPGEQWEEVFLHYNRLLNELRNDTSAEIVMYQPMLTDIPLDCNPELPVIRQVGEILESMQLDGKPIGVPFGSDASKLAAIGIPSVILGPGCIDQAHTADEFVDCFQVEKAVEMYRKIMQLSIR